MTINYDIDVVCPTCSAKAQFTFPFRRIYEEHIAVIKDRYTNATFSEISACYKPDNGIIVNELFGGKVWMKDPTWLMNLYPLMFSETDELDKKIGLIKCLECGSIQKATLTDELYFYKVAVDSRYLLARKKENLIGLRNWFALEKRPHVGTEDFPKSFYAHRDLIIRGIDKLLQAEV